MLEKRHGSATMTTHARRNEAVQAATHAYDAAATGGANATIYNFGVGVVDGAELSITGDQIRIPGYDQAIDLNVPNPYADMT